MGHPSNSLTVHYVSLNDITTIIKFIGKNKTISQISEYLYKLGLSQSEKSNIRILSVLIRPGLVEKKLENKIFVSKYGKMILKGDIQENFEIYHFLSYNNLPLYRLFVDLTYELLYSVINGNQTLGNEHLIPAVLEIVKERIDGKIPSDHNLRYYLENSLKILYGYSKNVKPQSIRNFKISNLAFKKDVSSYLLLKNSIILGTDEETIISLKESQINLISKSLFIDKLVLRSLFNKIPEIIIESANTFEIRLSKSELLKFTKNLEGGAKNT